MPCKDKDKGMFVSTVWRYANGYPNENLPGKRDFIMVQWSLSVFIPYFMVLSEGFLAGNLRPQSKTDAGALWSHYRSVWATAERTVLLWSRRSAGCVQPENRCHSSEQLVTIQVAHVWLYSVSPGHWINKQQTMGEAVCNWSVCVEGKGDSLVWERGVTELQRLRPSLFSEHFFGFLPG